MDELGHYMAVACAVCFLGSLLFTGYCTNSASGLHLEAGEMVEAGKRERERESARGFEA